MKTRKFPNAFREVQKKQKNASAQYKRHTLFRNSMFAASCDENYTVNHLHQLTKPLTATSTGVAVDNSSSQSGRHGAEYLYTNANTSGAQH